MRRFRPLVTTYAGLSFLFFGAASLGLITSALMFRFPSQTAPFVRAAFLSASWLLGTRLIYDPAMAPFHASYVAAASGLWACGGVYALSRKPAQDRKLDRHLASEISGGVARGEPLEPL